VEYVHLCVYCGAHREAPSLTMLAPRCSDCGCALRAATREEFERLAPTLSDDPFVPTHRRDTTAVFGVLVALPFLLPALGVHVSDVAFAIPLAMLIFAAVRCAAAARLHPARRAMWIAFGAACSLAAAASALAVASAVEGRGLTAAFYLGAGGSIALLAGAGLLLADSLRGARLERIVDGLLLSGVVVAAGTYVIVVPGLRFGDPVLTSVFLVDLLAIVLATMAVMIRPYRVRRMTSWTIVAACGAAALGDAVVAAHAAHQLASVPALTAVLWTATGFALATAAEGEAPPSTEQSADAGDGNSWRWLGARVALPLAAVLSFPAMGVAVWALDGYFDTWRTVYFGAFFALALIVVLCRQAYLLLDNHRAVTRERRLRQEAQSRNTELEALTGLATTMTQTLEEAPIIEQALGVLHLAARATSSALHVRVGEGLALAATTGEWQSDEPWAGTPPAELEPEQVQTRGGRSITRMRLDARGHAIGVVTLVHAAAEPLQGDKLALLRLLVDEMAVAVQNARDYREKLEQAIRDPLTGLYNRRFFFEALDKEVRRQERYGSPASLVIFDVDDFKSINDGFGHAAGDDVLRKIARIGTDMLRPVDSLARIGGEEFALLLPETQQLDALLVAERMRTAVSRSAMLPGRKVTVSGGVSSCPQDATTREDLEQRADAALYWAKRNGKDLCAVASEVVHEDQGADTEGDGMLAHLYAMVSTIDARHLHTRDHSENVAAYAVAIGQALGLERERIMAVRRAALLHDIGKITVSGEILAKPGKLDHEEWAQIHRHPLVGATMLAHAGLAEESRWIRHHHERVDGDGYPSGLMGERIPLEARIIFVADSFEAMTSDRPYRAGMEIEEAMDELRRHAGSQFDPLVVDALEGLVARGELAVLALRSAGLEPATAAI
jgi:diguanylate cyclase (GGDEF)-like protein